MRSAPCSALVSVLPPVSPLMRATSAHRASKARYAISYGFSVESIVPRLSAISVIWSDAGFPTENFLPPPDFTALRQSRSSATLTGFFSFMRARIAARALLDDRIRAEQNRETEEDKLALLALPRLLNHPVGGKENGNDLGLAHHIGIPQFLHGFDTSAQPSVDGICEFVFILNLLAGLDRAAHLEEEALLQHIHRHAGIGHRDFLFATLMGVGLFRACDERRDERRLRGGILQHDEERSADSVGRIHEPAAHVRRQIECGIRRIFCLAEEV